MPKSEIHPKWYPDAKVICNGEVVMSTGSTQPELHVDVWSGNLEQAELYHEQLFSRGLTMAPIEKT